MCVFRKKKLFYTCIYCIYILYIHVINRYIFIYTYIVSTLRGIGKHTCTDPVFTCEQSLNTCWFCRKDASHVWICLVIFSILQGALRARVGQDVLVASARYRDGFGPLEHFSDWIKGAEVFQEDSENQTFSGKSRCEVERGDTPETIYRISLALKATFSLAQALNTPILGYLSDRFGRRPVAGLERTFHSASVFFLIILALEIKTDTPHVMQEFWAQVLLVALAAESLVFWMQGYGGFWLNWRSTLRPQSMNSQNFGERVSLRETQSCLGWAGASHRITSCPRLQAYLMNFDDKVQHNSSWSNCTTFSNLNRILNSL